MSFALYLADVLRGAGLDVVEHGGWRTRGRPGRFEPRALMLHHDASNRGPSPTIGDYIIRGRPESGTPGPLSQLWISQRRWHVLAAGRCNHAGRGRGFGRVPADSGNTYALGAEWDHTTGEPVDPVEYDVIARGFAALADALALSVARDVFGHREYAPGRKSDPDIDLDRFRANVAADVVVLRSARNRPPRLQATAPTSKDPDMASVVQEKGDPTQYIVTADGAREMADVHELSGFIRAGIVPPGNATPIPHVERLALQAAYERVHGPGSSKVHR